MWIVDLDADVVRAYNLSSGSYDSSKDFSLTSENSDPTGIWFDNETVWVADSVDDKIYSYSSAALVAPVVNSRATGRPAIAGSVEVGRVLTVVTSGISDGNGVSGSFSYQWVRVVGVNEVDIFGANSSTYTLVTADVGRRLKVKVSFVDNDNFPEGPLVSVLTETVAAAPVVNSPATGRPTILGTVQVGGVLTVVTSGISDGNGIPDGSFVYQWVRVDGGVEVDISGATGSTYQLVSVDEGKKLKVEVSFVDGGGFSEGPLASDATALVPAPVNNPPVFTSSSSFSVSENVRSVGNVVASDSDSGDSVSGYSVSGGVDGSLFSVTSGGVLTFNSAPDFESPADSGGNNVYNVVVIATSGTGTRVQNATQIISVTVNDVAEAPSAPGRPVLGSPSSTSLSVSWSAPSNTGPAISDYDVGYGRNLNGPFTDWSHSGNSTTATITGLNVSTLYFVRVRAVNVEGSSGWSPTASFTTSSVSPTPVTNNVPVFSSGSSFSVNGNVSGVGTVVASDSDGEDSVSGYVVSGGVDSALFSITDGGVLTFNSAPDFEVPVDVGGDNVYDLVVTVTSGVGGRVLSANQSIVVTVVDVNEGGGKPVIGGTFGYRQVLTVDTSGIRDVDGIPDGFDSFIWYRTNGSDPDLNYDSIDGAMDMTYRVSYEDLGEHLWVEVSYLDGVGRRHYLFSDSTGEVPFPNLVEGSSSRLVSNMGQSSNSSDFHSVVYRFSAIQEFTTGGSFDYVLEKVVLNVHENSSDSPSVYIYTQNSLDPFVILSGDVDSLGRKEFTAPPGSFLKGNVTYSVSADAGSHSYQLYSLWSTSSGDEDSGAASGWSISNVTVSPTSSFPLKIEVHGRSRDFPDVSLPHPVNNPPVFTSSSTFSVSENAVSVGTVVASDVDGGDSVTGYVVSGVDGGRFSITSGGVLTFRSAPDYESPADSGGDNVYDLVVTVNSGVGGRELSAIQSVTVTVVDVVEAPSDVTSVVVLSQDFGNLSSVGNNAPRGIWSSGGVMYVVDSDDYRVYAYNVSTKDFILNQSFDLFSDVPWGIWSDNETVWVAVEFDSSNDYVDAYNLSDKSRDWSKDFSMSNADFSPRGIWSDGVTMWIVQEKGNLSYVDVYKMSDASSDSGKNFNLTVGHDSPGGVWSDGVIMWIVDLDADVVRAYNLSSGSYDSSKDFSLTSENSDPTGIWFDNETVWVADSVDDKIYSYSSAALVAPVVNSPAVGRPGVTGAVRVGGVLTADTSGISDANGIREDSFVYQWVRVDGGTETESLRVLKSLLLR